MEEIEKAARKRPFVPFEVHTADGRKYLLDHPERFFLSNRTIFTLDRNRNAVFIDVLLVMAVRKREDLVRPNGRRKKSSL